MRLSTLRLQNFCQFADREFDIGPGLVGIVGSNGNGKTNMSSTALQFALTGSASEASGRRWRREDLLRHGASKGHVELVFDTGDAREAVVRWGVPGNSQRLEIDGEIHASKAEDVRRALSDFYGMPVDDVAASCFMPQTSLRHFVDMLPTARADMLKSLFGAQDTEAAMADIQAEISAVGAVADFSRPLADARRDLAEAEAALSRAAEDAAGWRGRLSEARAGYEAALGRLQLPVAGVRSGRAAELRTEADRAAAALASHEALRPGVPQAPEVRADGAEMRELLRTYSREHARFSQIEARLAALSSELEGCAAGDSVFRLSAAVDGLQAEADAAASARLAATAAVGDHMPQLRFVETRGVCPASRQACPVALSPSDVELVRQAHAGLEAEQARAIAAAAAASKSLSEARQALDAARRDEDARDVRRRSISGQMAQARTELDALGAWLSDAYARIEGFDDQAYGESLAALEAHREAQAAQAAHDRRSLELSRALDAARIRAADAERPQEGVTQAEHDAARGVVALYRSAEAGLEAARSTEARRRSELAAAGQALSMLERDADRARANALVRDGLEALRQFFHRSAGPAYVVRSNLARYNRALAVHLDTLGMGIRAWVGDDFELLFDKPEAGVRSMLGSKLSGAEGVAVALAERLARRDVCSCRVPLLVLDEPAAAMSADNMQALVQLLMRLRDKVRGQITVLVPSHAQALEPCFERIIRI